MIKVEFDRREDETTLFFESRTTDDDSLKELDHLYEILMSGLARTALGGGYDNTARFSITLKNPG